MLLIDHDMGLVLEVCDRVVVLDLGTVIADGPPAAIRTDPKVTQAYLGTSEASSGAPSDASSDAPSEGSGATAGLRSPAASA
jgi:ABC-type glutathione transport system ATPase component